VTQICFTIILPFGQDYGKTNLSCGLRPRNYKIIFTYYCFLFVRFKNVILFLMVWLNNCMIHHDNATMLQIFR